MIRRLAVCAVLLIACGEESTSESVNSADATTGSDAPGDVAESNDGGVEVDPAWAAVPEPTDRLVAGVAEVDLRFPVGSATVGYAPGKGANSPYAMTFPGTDAQHTKLTAKAVVMRNGGEALALVRTDTIGVWQDIVVDVMARLRDLGRADLAEGLICLLYTSDAADE